MVASPERTLVFVLALREFKRRFALLPAPVLAGHDRRDGYYGSEDRARDCGYADSIHSR